MDEKTVVVGVDGSPAADGAALLVVGHRGRGSSRSGRRAPRHRRGA
jgi:hypothetical protein